MLSPHKYQHFGDGAFVFGHHTTIEYVTMILLEGPVCQRVVLSSRDETRNRWAAALAPLLSRKPIIWGLF